MSKPRLAKASGVASGFEPFSQSASLGRASSSGPFSGNRQSGFSRSRPTAPTLVERLKELPYWLIVALLLGVFFLWSFVSQDDYRVIFFACLSGLLTTLYVTLVAFFFSILGGFVLGLMRVSPNRFLREISSFYIEIVRGIPMLVILFYIAFVGAPGIVEAANFVLSPLVQIGLAQEMSIRNLDFTTRAIIALCLGYSAFIAEIVRSGIESIGRGQLEAALALGLSRRQAMVKIILPQAARNVLPPLANEFIAMVKDSALVSALGVQDVTQIGKVYASGTFKFFETYNVVAFLYLVLTFSLSLGVRVLEKRLSRHKIDLRHLK